MAYNKTTWENAPSTNTPINANNLNKIEEGIYQNSLKSDQVGDLSNLETDIKTNIVSAINEIKDGEEYSTDEIKTNKKWINGEPIYRKVVAVDFPTSSSKFALTQHNISNIEMVTDFKLVWYDINDQKWYVNFKDTTGTYVEKDGVSTTDIRIKADGTTVNWQGRTSNRYAILEYTKSN